MAVLTFVDVLRVQDFVFETNRLKDIAAASDLVDQATSVSTLKGMAGPGQVVFAAGANALLAFPDLLPAKAFAARYSRSLIEDFPGLDVELVHVVHEPGGWRDAFERAQQEMQIRKLTHRASAPLLGLSVTAECEETQRVAAYRVQRGEGPEQPVSREVWARRRDNAGVKKERWRRYLTTPEAAGTGIEFPLELDDLGRSAGDLSLIGVVHVDGNGVGRALERSFRERAGLPDQDLQAAQGAVSAAISGLVEGALKAVLERVRAAIRRGEELDRPSGFYVWSDRVKQGFQLALSKRGGIYLPIRPVLMGGDDLTFVCDGRIALDLARVALEFFRDHGPRELDEPIGACAGIALVRSHAPFSRAYRLAEALCSNAKAWLREMPYQGLYALDWHIGYTTPFELLDELRNRQYRSSNFMLTMRPYALDPHSGGDISFGWLDRTVLGPTGAAGAAAGLLDDFWLEKRNKIKELRETLRQGPDEVGRTLQAWGKTAGVDALPSHLEKTNGFLGGCTPLLDAIELLDVHIPLDRGTA